MLPAELVKHDRCHVWGDATGYESVLDKVQLGKVQALLEVTVTGMSRFSVLDLIYLF